MWPLVTYSNSCTWRCVSIILCYEGWPVITYVCVLLCYKILFAFYCIVLRFTVCCQFCKNHFLWISLSFLYMIIYEVLYAWCLRYNTWNAWFLDIRISTCFFFIHILVNSTEIPLSIFNNSMLFALPVA